MSKEKYNFQLCPKVVVFNKDKSEVLLAKRAGEADYDGTFSFIGGKLEATDESYVAGIEREKNEEVGVDFKVNLSAVSTMSVFFTKKDGSKMVLPHHPAIHVSGEVNLNEEYSEYRWVKISDLQSIDNKIDTIIPAIESCQNILSNLAKNQFVQI